MNEECQVRVMHRVQRVSLYKDDTLGDFAASLLTMKDSILSSYMDYPEGRMVAEKIEEALSSMLTLDMQTYIGGDAA